MTVARYRVPVALFLLLAPAALLRAPTTVHAASSASISVVPVVQKYGLDCEAAALQMALAAVGITASQDQLLRQFGADLRRPVMTNGVPSQWGDPYQTFVGQVTGSFMVTGYGVYYPPIVNAAIAEGAAANGGRWRPGSALRRRRRRPPPVVVTVPHLMEPSSVGQWTAWGGRQVWYSNHDHAQVLIGYDDNAGTVTLADPLTDRFTRSRCQSSRADLRSSTAWRSR